MQRTSHAPRTVDDLRFRPKALDEVVSGKDLLGVLQATRLAERRGFRNTHDLPPLTVEQILAWADAFHTRTGNWPTKKSGPIPDTKGETWLLIDGALRQGARGFSVRSSLPKLLAAHRGVRNRKQLPPYTEDQILAWADAHHRRTGAWPTAKSGPIVDTPGETWTAVQVALCQGRRGLPGGSSLPLLLADKRGVRNVWSLPNLSVPGILGWAEAFHERMGSWPNQESGPIQDAPGETWMAVDMALKRGSRGLSGSTSLAELLAIERGVRNRINLPPLTRKQILAWADAHFRRTGKWPTLHSGKIEEAPDETWAAMEAALNQGSRGLRPGRSLARLLAKHRGRRNIQDLPPLTIKKILAWADAHHARTGRWPNTKSGTVTDAPDENWRWIDHALRAGQRGLQGGTSLPQILARKRGVRNHMALGPLTEEGILRWAELHFQRTGQWPTRKSGPVADAPGETWSGVQSALHNGKRGLPGGSTLPKLLARQQGLRNRKQLPPLTEQEILRWADLHRERTGKYPCYRDGPVADAPGETWAAFDTALRCGRRGLPGGSSLAKLLSESGRPLSSAQDTPARPVPP